MAAISCQHHNKDENNMISVFCCSYAQRCGEKKAADHDSANFDVLGADCQYRKRFEALGWCFFCPKRS